MNSKIEFTYYEINALNKLLGEIKTEPYLSADEIHFFALSPFIAWHSPKNINREKFDMARKYTLILLDFVTEMEKSFIATKVFV